MYQKLYEGRSHAKIWAQYDERLLVSVPFSSSGRFNRLYSQLFMAFMPTLTFCSERATLKNVLLHAFVTHSRSLGQCKEYIM